MSYHRGGHAGAVAVSYGTSPMAPLSPSRRYSSGSTGTNTSGIGSATSKFNTYRSSGSSILDRPSNYYSSSSRSSYLSEYRRSFCSPARSVSSVYSDAGTGSAFSNSIRFSPSASSSSSSSISSRERSETRDTLGSLATSAADIIAKYSPSGYVPNIHSNSHATSIYGGNAADARTSGRDRDRVLPTEQGSPSAPPSSSVGTIGGSRASRISWRPPLGTLLTNHALADSSPSSTEVTTNDTRNNNDNNNSNSNDSCSSGNNDNNNSNCEINRGRQYDASLPANTTTALIISAAVVSPNPTRTNLTNPSNNAVLTNNNDQDSKPLEDHGSRDATSDDKSGPNVIVRAWDNLANQRSENRGDAPPPPPPPPPLPSTLLSSLSASASSSSSSTTTTTTTAATTSSSREPTLVAANGSPPIVPGSVESERSSFAGSHAGDPTSGASTSRRTDVVSTENASASDDAAPSSSAAATHRNDYRSVSEQIEGSPTSRSTRNRLQAYRDERCGLNGLRNIGNTCFMNSVIQCLSNTRPLLEYLLNEQYLNDINTTTSSMKGALIKAFSQVIQELWEVGGDHVVNTTSLKSQIQRFAPRFMGYSQQDAQEFLRYLLEGLHEDVNRVTIKPQPIHTDIPDHYTDSQKAAESWKRYLRSEDSTIVDVFVGQLRSSLHCTFCGHVSVTLDPFWDLSLPIPTRSGTVKLNQCLEHFTKEEVLDGDEKPTCSKCQMRRKCTKSFSIQKFPKILVIHLKRFSPMERFRGKLNVLVDFPLTGLDLGAFAAPRVQGCTYNLYGVANHSGTTYSGHYTAYCKHPYSGEWHEYNDSRVSSVPARSVVSSEAYVLFYEQQPHSSHL